MTATSVWFTESNPELLIEIGRVTVRWAAVDLLLVSILEPTLNDNEEAAQTIIFGKENAGQQRFRAFERTIGASKLGAEMRVRILDLMKKISDLHEKRNAIVHEPLDGRFRLEGKTIVSSLVSVNRKGVRKDVDITAIKKHVAEMDDHLVELERIYLELSQPFDQGDDDSDSAPIYWIDD